MDNQAADEVVRIARKELLEPEFAVTEQYLEVMELELADGLPVVARIEPPDQDGIAVVYFSIQEEDFFIAVSVKTAQQMPGVGFVWVESGHRVYLMVTSSKLNYAELSETLGLPHLSGWSKGEITRSGNSAYQSTCVHYEPITSLAYSLEDKLEKLLVDLESKKSLSAALAEQERAVICVCKYQYISGNAGISFSPGVISRLSRLNLEVDIDTYISGQEIR